MRAATVEIRAFYPDDPDTVFASALNFSEMENAMRGLATYSGLPASGTAREGDSFSVDVTFWKLFTVRGHQIHIERLDVANRIIQSRERAQGVARWDHQLSVQPSGAMTCWIDRVEIAAGWKTWAVARFSAFVYARRHRFRQAIKIERRISSD
jgi:hypothetical protein